MGKEYWIYHSHGLQGGEITENNGKMMLLWLQKKVSSQILQLQVLTRRFEQGVFDMVDCQYWVSEDEETDQTFQIQRKWP